MSVVILFAHGARDSRWAEPLKAIASEIRALSPQTRVELAFLELMEPSLEQVVSRLYGLGVVAARLVPVFLGGSGHVLRDLPSLIQQCGELYPSVKLETTLSVGQDQRVIRAIATVALDIPQNQV